MALYSVGAKPVQIIWAASKTRLIPARQFLITNRDETQQIYIAHEDPGGHVPDMTTPSRHAVFPVDALGNVTVLAGLNWWAISPSGQQVTVAIADDGGEWSPSPAQVAIQLQTLGLMLDTTGQAIHTSTTAVNTTLGAPAQDPSVTALPQNIYNTKIPPAVSTALLGSGSTINIAAGTTKNFGPFSIDQPGFELWTNATETAAGNAGPLTVVLNWADASLSRTIWQDEFYPVAAAALNNHQVFAYGRTRGTSVTLSVINNDSAAINFSYAIAQMSRNPEEIDIRTFVIGTVNGFTPSPVIDTGSGMLAQRSTLSLGAGASLTDLLPLFYGQVFLHTESSSGTSDLTVKIFPLADSVSTPLYAKSTDGNGELNDYLQLSASQCTIQLINGNAAAKNVRYTLQGIPT